MTRFGSGAVRHHAAVRALRTRAGRLVDTGRRLQPVVQAWRTPPAQPQGDLDQQAPPVPSADIPSALMQQLLEAVRAVHGGRVVVLTSSPHQAEPTALLRAAGADVRVFPASTAPARTGEADDAQRSEVGQVYRHGRDGLPLAAVVDLREDAQRQRAMFRELMFTVAPRGVYLLHPAADPRSWIEVSGEVVAADRYLREHGRAVRAEHVDGWTLLRKNVRHVLKINDLGADRLRSRCPDLTVETIERRPATAVTSHAVVTHHPPADRRNYDERFTTSELVSRRYSGTLVRLTHLLTLHGLTALPPSYRFPFAVNPANPRLIDHNRDHATLTKETSDQLAADRPTLSGSYFEAGSAWPHHFGHWMTEVPARLWGWPRAKAADPDLKALVTLLPGQQATFERLVLNAYGIPDTDIEVVHGPVNLRSLVAATPAWHNQRPYFGHPMMPELWRDLGDRLQTPGESPRRIFVSRTSDLVRSCHQAQELEEFLVERGFSIIRPETIPLGEQVHLFRSAETIAGFTGSGMFNLMFAPARARVLLFSSENYTARHEHLITSLLGNRVDYFWGPADIQHPRGGWTQTAFDSPWSFDLERHAAAIDAALDR